MPNVDDDGPRAEFLHGDDCEITFIGQNDNFGALVDEWRIRAEGEVFQFHMMKMKKSQGPWVFGSFRQGRRQVWKFKEDKRVEDGFRGSVYTCEHKGKTYALFIQNNELMHAVPFVDMLLEKDVHPDSKQTDRFMRDIAQENSLYFPQQAIVPVQTVSQDFKTKKHLSSAGPVPVDIIKTYVKPHSSQTEQEFFLEVFSRMMPGH